MARLIKTQIEERNAALVQLRQWLKPGDTVYTVLRHVSRSGMQREIGVVLLLTGRQEKGSEIVDLHPNYLVSKVLGWPTGERDGIKVDGCGMDMGFHLVYSLSRCLFPDGFGIAGEGPYGHKGSPGSREAAARMVSEGWKFRGRNGDTSGWDDDGGYALKQRWL